MGSLGGFGNIVCVFVCIVLVVIFDGSGSGVGMCCFVFIKELELVDLVSEWGVLGWLSGFEIVVLGGVE